MITKNTQTAWHDILPGIRVSTLVRGEKTLMARFELQKGAFLPLHSHPHEQAGYLLSGLMTMTIDGLEHQFGPGDSWCIAGGVEHGAVVLETCLVIEVFSPVREDYLPYLPKATADHVRL